MDTTFATEGVIINRSPWREVDSRVLVFTHEAGKLDLVARGTQKISSKLAGHLELFNRVRLMVINGKSRAYVGGVASIDNYVNIKHDLDKLRWVGYWLAIFNQRVKANERDRNLYYLLVKSLTVFNNIKSSRLYYQALANLLILKLMTSMGEGIDWQDKYYQAIVNELGPSQLASYCSQFDQSRAPKFSESQAQAIITLASLKLSN